MPSEGIFRTPGRALLVAAVLTLTSGCGQTVDGRATAGLTSVDPAVLEVGPYSTEPTAYEPEFDFKDAVFQVESRRMLDYLVAPFTVDPELSHLDRLELVSTDESLYGDGYRAVYPVEFRPVAERHHLISGVVTTRSNDSTRALRNLVHSLLRFPSDEAARAAAAEFEAVMYTRNPGLRKVAVPGRAGVRFSTSDDQKGYLFLARGPFLVLTMATMPIPDLGALTAQVTALVDRQLERLESATATPVDEILDLPMDPDGIMRRVLPPADGEYVDNDRFTGALSAAARLHLEPGGEQMSSAFEDAGVDLVASNAATLYRTSDLQAAFRLQTALARPGDDDEEIDPPPGLPDARCRVLEERALISNFTTVCVLVHDRYVAVVGSDRVAARGLDPALYQRAAAQYVILARSA